MPLLGVLGIAIGFSVVVGWGPGTQPGNFRLGSGGDAQSFFDGLAVSFGSIPGTSSPSA